MLLWLPSPWPYLLLWLHSPWPYLLLWLPSPWPYYFLQVMHNYLEANDDVPWADLQYNFGEIMYGGHI